jgi:septin family protein
MLACTSSGLPDIRKAPYFLSLQSLITVRSLKPLDIEIMKRLGTRVNLIPVVAKADTLTQDGLFDFKERVSLFNLSFLFLP